MKGLSVTAVVCGVLLRSSLVVAILISGCRTQQTLTCPCGTSGETYTHSFDERSAGNLTCETWSQCQTCRANLARCLTCPPNRNGPICTEASYSSGATCSDPGAILSGYRILRGGTASKLYPFYTNGQAFQYYCNQGYRLSGADILICLTSGDWSNEKPSCQPMHGTPPVAADRFCPHPGVNVNGFMESDDVMTTSGGVQGFAPGAELRYLCREGYELVGKENLVCKLNGEWSAFAPSCKRLRNPTPAPTGPFCYHPGLDVNGFLKSDTGMKVYGPRQGFPAGAEVTYQCKHGFELVGVSTIICKLDGKWSADVPTCKRALTATAPPPTGKICFIPTLSPNVVLERIPSHDRRRRGDGFEAGSQVSFSCKGGYEMEGDVSIICLLNGKWNTKPPTCKKSTARPPQIDDTIPCSDPGSIQNGGVIVYYNNPSIIRQPSAQLYKYPVNTRLSYDCSEGYVLQGEKNISCRSDGQWTGQIPMCTEDCGYSKFRTGGKVTNGNSTKAGEFPWVVHIWINQTRQTCGGVLLDKRTVLSVAHCFEEAEYCTMYFGKYNRSDSKDDKYVEVRTSSEIIMHPEYNMPVPFDNDIAIIKFFPEVPYSPRIQPICLPTSDSTAKNIVAGQNGYVAGWGLTETQTVSPVLVVASLPVQDDATCELAYKKRNTPIPITPGMFCAGFSDKEINVCRGYSGSPLVFYNEETDRYTVEGLVSHGTRGRCDEAEKYTIFTKVSNYFPWIKSNWRRENI